MDSSRDIIRQTKDIYNKIASFFSDTRQYVKESEKTLVKYTKEGDKILDLGCGNGKLYHLFEKMQVDYVGSDLSEGLIDIAKKQWPHLTFVVGDMADKLPFEDNTFDVIYCIASFHHLPDEEKRLNALKEMKRVLKKDGRLVMKNWNLGSDWANKKLEKGKYTKIGEYDFIVPWRDPKGNILGDRYYHSFTQDELKDLFEQSGFVIDKQYFEEEPYLSDYRGGRNIVSVVHKISKHVALTDPSEIVVKKQVKQGSEQIKKSKRGILSILISVLNFFKNLGILSILISVLTFWVVQYNQYISIGTEIAGTTENNLLKVVEILKDKEKQWMYLNRLSGQIYENNINYIIQHYDVSCRDDFLLTMNNIESLNVLLDLRMHGDQDPQHSGDIHKIAESLNDKLNTLIKDCNSPKFKILYKNFLHGSN